VATMSDQTGLSWHVVEEAINHEADWLRNVITQNPAEKKPGCDECQYTFGKIALLIITGKIKAKDITAKDGHDLWDGLTKKHSIAKSAWHGGDWHRKMMDLIAQYFESDGFEVVPEPALSKSRADLGVYKNGYWICLSRLGPRLFTNCGGTCKC